MKILIVGASGSVGSAVAADLGAEFEIITAGSNSGDVLVDITSSQSIIAMYAKVGKIDAVVSTVGKVAFKPLNELTEIDFNSSFANKFMGQINLVLLGQKYLSTGGSFTLTSGILSHEFIPNGLCASAVNGAINSFVKASALELMHSDLRINAISPTILEGSYQDFYPLFSGFYPVSSKKVAFAYRKSVTGVQTGQVFSVGHHHNS